MSVNHNQLADQQSKLDQLHEIIGLKERELS